MILSCLHLLWIWVTFYQEWKFSKMCSTNDALILGTKDFSANLYLRTVTTLNIFQQSTSQNKDNLRLLRYCSSVGQEFIVVHWILIFRLKIFEIEFSSILGHSLFELSVFLNHWNHGHWGDHITVQIFNNFISNVLNRPSGRVSVQGVESLWGDCRFIPAGWESQ